MADGSKIGRRIGERRREKGITLPDLAKRAGTSKGYLWMLETHWEKRPNEAAPNPGLDLLTRLAEQLDVTVADLIGEDSAPRQAQEMSSVKMPAGLPEFLAVRESQGRAVPESDIRDLIGIKLRGVRPSTADEWARIYDFLVETLPSREQSS